MKSLKFSKKYFIFILFFLIVILVFCIYSTFKASKTKEIPIFQNSSWRAQKEMISPRDAQVENYLNFPEKFPSASFEDRLFHLVFYFNSDGDKVQNFEGPYGNRAGVMVFENQTKIWESKESIAELYDHSAEFKDITGDGVPEIVVIDGGGGNGVSCGVNVYKWNENTFQLITPSPDIEDGINPCNGADATKGGFIDVDNNGAMELISFRWDKAYPKIIDNNDPRFYATKEIKLIYKFNGTKYFLLEEIPTGIIRN
jgi:hypothetical protein